MYISHEATAHRTAPRRRPGRHGGGSCSEAGASAGRRMAGRGRQAPLGLADDDASRRFRGPERRRRAGRRRREVSGRSARCDRRRRERPAPVRTARRVAPGRADVARRRLCLQGDLVCARPARRARRRRDGGGGRGRSRDAPCPAPRAAARDRTRRRPCREPPLDTARAARPDRHSATRRNRRRRDGANCGPRWDFGGICAAGRGRSGGAPGLAQASPRTARGQSWSASTVWPRSSSRRWP